MTAQATAFFVIVALVEAAWLASLDYLLGRFGMVALGGALVVALGVMVAVLDATPLGGDAPTDRLNTP